MSAPEFVPLPVFDAQGRRLYTLPQIAELLGREVDTVHQWRRRKNGKIPREAGSLDERTPLWLHPDTWIDSGDWS